MTRKVSAEVVLDMPRSQAWNKLRDISLAHNYVPGIVKTEIVSEHVMHFERFEVPAATLQAVADCRTRGGRVVAVGTTSVRTLESWARSGVAQGDTQIFITPGFAFQVVDVLVTNFHLPKSTLMMLVSAFAGYEHVMALYRHAITQGYRFFSYGDAMLLARQPENDPVRSGR